MNRRRQAWWEYFLLVMIMANVARLFLLCTFGLKGFWAYYVIFVGLCVDVLLAASLATQWTNQERP